MIKYQDQWDQLYVSDPEAQFFQSRNFIEPIVARKPRDFVYLTVKEGAKLVGLMPLRAKLRWDDRRNCFRTDLVFAGSKHWADYNAPLVSPRVERQVIESLTRKLKYMKWGRLRLKNLRMSAARQAAFFEAFPETDFRSVEIDRMINGGSTNNLLCAAIPLPATFDEYLAGLSRSTRQKLRRLLRRLDAGDFTIRYGQTREDIEVFMDLWIKLWASKKDAERLTRTYGRILLAGLDRGCLSMPMLERDGQVLGVLANFVDPVKRATSFFVSARDPDVKDTAIGLMMHAYEIRRFIGEGFDTYDLLRGDEPYKMQLGAEISDIRYTVVRRRSGTSNSACLSELSYEPLKIELKSLLNDAEEEVAKIAEKQLRTL